LFISLYTYSYLLAALIISLLGLWKGDRPLRWVAGVTLVSWCFTPLLRHWDRYDLNVPQTITDIVTAAVYIWISLRWRRLWVVILSALAIMVVLCPFVGLADARVHRNSWVAANNILAIFQLIVISVALGLFLRARRRADEGAVRP
jgi:hypothetical protein